VSPFVQVPCSFTGGNEVTASLPPLLRAVIAMEGASTPTFPFPFFPVVDVISGLPTSSPMLHEAIYANYCIVPLIASCGGHA
jgi:hypothetical protein